MANAPPPSTPDAVRTIGDEAWHGPAAALDALAGVLTDGSAGRVVKENRRRTVTCYPWPGGGTVYVKRFHDAGVGQTVKALAFGARAQREIRFAHELAAAGIPVAEPLAWADRPGHSRARGAVATRGVDGGVPAIEVVHDPSCPPARRRRILEMTARWLRAAHDAGIGFRDFHLGNVLVTPDDALTFIDLQSAWRPGPLMGRIRLVNLAMGLTSIPPAAWRDARRALRVYGSVPGLTEREVARWAARRAQRMTLRHFRSRAERCLRDSSEFVRERRAAGRLFRRRDCDGEAVLTALRQARDRLRAPDDTVLKDAPESAVVRGLDCGGRPVVAKLYRAHRGLAGARQWLGWGRGRRAWVAGNTCRALQVPVAEPLALCEQRGGEAWLLMEDLHAYVPLDRLIATELQTARRARRAAFARSLGTVLGAAHAAGVLHSDWKACNVLAGPADAIAFVDYDRVAFLSLREDRPVRFGEACEALRQLNCSVPAAVSRPDRLRVLRAYAEAAAAAVPADARRLLAEVWRISRNRNILWVGPAGDVHERWSGAPEPAA